jgi:predicted  nucleic acid-binding Zn-ribbon protein
MTTRTIRVLLPRAVALEVKRVQLQRAIRRMQKHIARVQDEHETLVNALAAVEKELKAQQP